MGISGLATFLKQHGKPQLRKWRRAAGDAGHGPPHPDLRIVLDGWAAVHHRIVQSVVSAPRESPAALEIAGGCLAAFLDAFVAFVGRLRDVSGGRLVVVFDGTLPKAKYRTRFDRDSGKLRTVRDAVSSLPSVPNRPGIGAVVPPLLFDRVVGRLRADFGMQVLGPQLAPHGDRPAGGIVFAADEADAAAAWVASNFWPQADDGDADTVVLSNDTDFLAMTPSSFSYASLESMALRAGDGAVELELEVFPPGYLASLLDLREDALPLFAGLVGNDLTGHFASTVRIPATDARGSASPSHRRILDAAAFLRIRTMTTERQQLGAITIANGGLPPPVMDTLELSSGSYRLPADPPFAWQHPKVAEIARSASFFCTPVLEDHGSGCSWEPGRRVRSFAYALLGGQPVTEYLRDVVSMASEVVSPADRTELVSLAADLGIRGASDLTSLPTELAHSLFTSILLSRLSPSPVDLPTALSVSFARSLARTSRLGNHELLAVLASLVVAPGTASPVPASAWTRRNVHLSACLQCFLASCSVLLRTLGLADAADRLAEWDAAPLLAALGRAKGGAGIAALAGELAAGEDLRGRYDEAVGMLGGDVDAVFDYAGGEAVGRAATARKGKREGAKKAGAAGRKARPSPASNPFHVLAAE
ncbi:hypothetical protein DFJ74DRAFT_775308 [Hyaloraphidium curvatum]|nr:hypothetical protein DFJ74DRAFT_775308 [Hyaloraphidium curvatum]